MAICLFNVLRIWEEIFNRIDKKISLFTYISLIVDAKSRDNN